MAADRAHHVATVIRPALAAGRDVICDRYIGSSVAYQGYGRGLDPEVIAEVSAFASRDLWPDVVIHLEVPDEVASQRMRASGQLDRLELAGEEFHRRVAHGFRSQAAEQPERWVTVEGTGSIEEVANRIDEVLVARRR